MNEIIDALKKTVGGIFCDLKKAFDIVNHDILLPKLEFYDTSGKFKGLIKSYLKKQVPKSDSNK
jgi:hypothetical protein